jgi:hypothetical protein
LAKNLKKKKNLMALKVKNFELPDKTILEEAYIRIMSISTANVDYDYLEPVLDGDDVITRWTTRLETKANVFVYGDEIARQNRVSPMNWFEFRFDLYLDSTSNIFEQAYLRLKQIYSESEDC